MLLTRGVPLLLLVLLYLYCLFDAISADSERVRNLPKPAWIVIVLFFPDVGSIMWLVAGRPRGAKSSSPYKGNTSVPPEYDRPGRAAAANPDDDAAFLEGLKRRAEEQRRRAEEERRRAGEDRQPETDPPA